MIVQVSSTMPRGKSTFSGYPDFINPSTTNAGLANFMAALMMRPSAGKIVRTQPTQSMAFAAVEDGEVVAVESCIVGSPGVWRINTEAQRRRVTERKRKGQVVFPNGL